jgi:hypothetical protein
LLQYAPQNQILGESGEVRGDLVGKAAPGRKAKIRLRADNKQEKYGASMAGSAIWKSRRRFSEKILLH